MTVRRGREGFPSAVCSSISLCFGGLGTGKYMEFRNHRRFFSLDQGGAFPSPLWHDLLGL